MIWTDLPVARAILRRAFAVEPSGSRHGMNHPLLFEVDDELRVGPARDGRLADCGEDLGRQPKVLFHLLHSGSTGWSCQWAVAGLPGCTEQQPVGVGGGLAKSPQQHAQGKGGSFHRHALPLLFQHVASRSTNMSNGSHLLFRVIRAGALRQLPYAISRLIPATL